MTALIRLECVLSNITPKVVVGPQVQVNISSLEKDPEGFFFLHMPLR